MSLLEVYDRTFDEDVPFARNTRSRDDQRHTDEQPDHPDADTHSADGVDETTEVES